MYLNKAGISFHRYGTGYRVVIEELKVYTFSSKEGALRFIEQYVEQNIE
jgi:hypothetical protein